MHCPNCLEDLKITERQGIEIDYCPKCRGVWLDRGELDKIIDRSLESLGGNRNQQAPPSGYYEQPHHDNRYQGKKKKKKKYKSILEEIFDFD